MSAPSAGLSLRPAHGVSLGEAARVWARIAALSFGGPAAQIAVMHRIVVDENRWIGEARFLHALSYCMLLPGPEATQLATYIGWLMHRAPGGLIAGILFILPGMAAIMTLSLLYVTLGQVPLVQAFFFGIKAAVLAIVLEAVVRIGRRALRNKVVVGLAALAFVAIFVFDVPFPLIVAGAALIGFLGAKVTADVFVMGVQSADDPRDAGTLLGEELPLHARPDATRAAMAALICLVLWLGPVAALLALLGSASVFTEIAIFFSKLAVVTFGGAYAVLAYMAQQAVETYAWLSPAEMLDGLGLAETTPGPLIMVTQFVGFIGAFRSPGGLPPLLAGALGGLLTTWVTFVPCFLWIFLGAPFIERLRQNRSLSGALAAITASVVGVILNLAVWFALHLWLPGGRIDPWAVALSAAAIALLFWVRRGIVLTLASCSAAGIVLYLTGQI